MRSRLNKHKRNVLIRSLSMLLQGFPGIKSPVSILDDLYSLQEKCICCAKDFVVRELRIHAQMCRYDQ